MKPERIKDVSKSKLSLITAESIGPNYIERSRTLNCSDPVLKKELKNKLEKLNKRGVTFSEFNDSVWEFKLPNADKITIPFNTLSEKLFKEEYEVCMPMQEFVEYLKYFCLLYIHENTIRTIQRRIRNLIKNVEGSRYFTHRICFPGEDGKINLETIKDFAKWLPVDNSGFLSLIQNSEIDVGEKNPRELADMQTYHILKEEIEEFDKEYKKGKNTKLRDFFLPMLIGWKIASVLPIRPTELSLLPYECIEYDTHTCRYILYYPVSDMKGTVEHKYLSYDMSNYTIASTYITEDIASLIIEYQQKTVNEKRHNGRLFSVEYMRKNAPFRISRIGEQFNAEHMQKLVDCFYDMILEKQKGYKILEKKDYKNQPFLDCRAVYGKKITRITMGDLRVLSMIGLRINGSSMKAMMALSHHRSPQMVEFYTHNLTNLLKSNIYLLLSRYSTPGVEEPTEVPEDVKTEQKKEAIREIFMNKTYKPFDMGLYWCCASSTGEFDFENCKNAVSRRPIGEVDVCKHCEHSRPKKQCTELIKISRDDELRADAKALCRMLPVGKGTASMATIQQAMEKVQQDSQVLFMDLIKEIAEERED